MLICNNVPEDMKNTVISRRIDLSALFNRGHIKKRRNEVNLNALNSPA